MENKKLPPKAINALVFGILSLGFNVLCFPTYTFVLEALMESGAYGPSTAFIVLPAIPSILFAVISLNYARRSEDAIKLKPELYRSTSMLKAARITAYLGVVLSFAALIFILVAVKRTVE